MEEPPLPFQPDIFLGGLGAVFGVMATLFLVSLIGYIGTRSSLVQDSTVTGLTKLLVDIIVPAQLAHAMIAGLDLETLSECGTIIVAMAGINFGCLALAAVVTRVWKGGTSVGDRSIWAMCSMQNAIYLPLPLLIALTPGELHVRVTILVSGAVVLMIASTWTMGVFLLRGEQTGEVSLKQSLRNALNPPLVAVFVGAALAFVPPFANAARTGDAAMPFVILVNAAEILGSALPPIAMLVLGMFIGQTKLRSALSLRTLTIPIIVRLLLAPAVMVWMLLAGPLEWVTPLVALVLIVQAAAPPATNLSIVARRYGGDWEMMASSLLVTYLFALITMPAFTALIMARNAM